MIELRCPNCNAQLNADDDLEVYFCNYCGTKIIINDRDRLRAKVKMRQYQRDENIKKLDNDIKKAEYVHKEKLAIMQCFKDRMDVAIFGGLIIFVLIIGGLFSLPGTISAKMEEKRLNSTYSKIEEMYRAEDYENALKEIDNLYYKGDNKNTAKDWDKKRNRLRSQIEESMGKGIKIITMPHKASYYHGNNYKDAVTELTELGFYDITTEREKESSFGTFFMKSDLVYEISINGITDFKEGDEFNERAVVVIRYTG